MKVSPCHPQTEGETGGHHRTIKREINLVPQGMLDEPKEPITTFIEYHNHVCYHEGHGDVRTSTRADISRRYREGRRAEPGH